MNRRSVLRSLTALVASPLAKSAHAGSLSALLPSDASACPVRLIGLNQLGFRPTHAKRAAVVLEGSASSASLPFRVLDQAGTVRHEGRLAPPGLDAASGDLV